VNDKILQKIFLAFAVVGAVLLAGCETAPRVEIQRVNVAVPVECKEPIPARPVMPTEALRLGATVDQFTQAAQAEIERREGYEVQLVESLAICTRRLRQ
jgi:predicted metal-binding protein